MRRTRDFIKVTNLKVFAYHGVLEEEKRPGFFSQCKSVFKHEKSRT